MVNKFQAPDTKTKIFFHFDTPEWRTKLFSQKIFTMDMVELNLQKKTLNNKFYTGKNCFCPKIVFVSGTWGP